MQRYLKIFFFSVMLFSCSYAFALPFTIVPKSGTTLPTTVPSGQTTTAYYTISNNTVVTRSNNFIKYLPPNTTQVTAGVGVCGSTFNLAAKGSAGDSCTLQLTVSGAVDANDPDPHHHLFACFPAGLTCAGTYYPLNVSVTSAPPTPTLVSIEVGPSSATVSGASTFPFTAMGTYSDGSTQTITTSVTWASSNTSIATINNAGVATRVKGGTTTITASLNGITSNPATLTFVAYAYITNITGNALSYCPIDTTTGTLSSCTATGGTFTLPRDVAIHPNGNFIYVVGSDATVCAINADRSVNTASCTSTGSLVNVAYSIAINAAGNIAYIGNGGTHEVLRCDVNATSGALTNCAVTQSVNEVRGIALHPTLNAAYVTNESNSVLYCTINSVTHDFTLCTPTPIAGMTSSFGIDVNSAGTYAYVTDTDNASANVTYCAINQTTGALTTCTTPLVTPVSSPYRITIDNQDSFAYISQLSGNDVYYCPVNNNGSLGACAITGSGLTTRSAIAIS